MGGVVLPIATFRGPLSVVFWKREPPMNRLLLIVLPCLLLVACGPSFGGEQASRWGEEGEGGEGDFMRPGEDCLACHDGTRREAPRFTVAGTVFDSSTAASSAGLGGVTVIITDANSAQTRLTTNAAGNFYTSKTIAPPYAVAVEHAGTRFAMAAPPSTGGCASCHSSPPANGAPGRIYAAP